MSDTEDPRIAALYRRASDVEPPAERDAAILAAAKRAARPRHYAPWAVAATLVLGVGIGWRVLHQAPPSLDMPMPAPPAQVSPEPAAASEADSAAADRAPAPAVRKSLSTQSAAPAGAAVENKRERPAPAAPRREQESAPQAPLGTLMNQPSLQGFAKHRAAPLERAADVACDDLVADEGLSAQALLEQIRAARESGDAARAGCLEVRYRERFGELPGGDQ